MRPSIRRVAEHAGVSRTTVSNLLNGRDNQASSETRERVLKAVRELHYIPVPQPMMQGRDVKTRVIGLAFGDVTINDPWGFGAFNGLCEAASGHKYDLLSLLHAGPDWMVDQEELRFLDRRSDGFIFLASSTQYKIMEALVQHGIPVVSCFLDDVPEGVPSVILDNFGALSQAVDLLVEHGHRRIAHSAGTEGRSDFAQRQAGYCNAMKRHRLQSQIVPPGPNLEQDLMAAIATGVTAFACASDHRAEQIWKVLEENSLRVPEDISLTGMDNLSNAEQRGLTSIEFSSSDVGRLAMETVVNMIAGDRYPENRVAVPVELVERTSVASPPRHEA